MQSRKTPRTEPERLRRPRGLVQEIVETLAANLREGMIKAGDKLPTESEIMLRFDVSRTVVREALSRLQASHLVETRHGIGTFALAPQDNNNFRITLEDDSTVADVIVVLELRISLETEAAGLAAQRRSETHLLAMQSALRSFQESITADSDAVPPDFQFHMEVARATGNRHFADLMTYLGSMIIPRARLNTPSSAPEGAPALFAARQPGTRKYFCRNPQPRRRSRPRRHAHPPEQQQGAPSRKPGSAARSYDDCYATGPISA